MGLIALCGDIYKNVWTYIIVGKFLQFQKILNGRWPLFLPFRYATLWAINL